jgi:murein DD-endopeptidase MepM/ murein hydrolase activator NlpD
MKVLNERKLLLPVILVFVYMFVPMLFTLNGTPNLRGSGSPVEELVVHTKPSPFDLDGAPMFRLVIPAPRFVQSSYEQEIERPNYLNYAHAVLPVHDPEISSDFGWRVAPCNACNSDHQGVDFVPGEGKPVMAILNGVVAEAGINQGYGHWVKIEHIVPIADGEVERWVTVYAHLKAGSIPDDVGVGATVARGQNIGLVGSTGISTGPHLHFELHIDGVVVDPLPIISQSQVIKDLEVSWK